MNPRAFRRCYVCLALLALVGFAAASAAPISLVSSRPPEIPPSATGNAHSGSPRWSRDGRYIAFTSSASNLVTNDHNGPLQDVFLRDLASNTTALLSVSSEGAAGNGDSSSPSISADGRWVAFLSLASNLVPGDTNDLADVFVRDRVEGTTRWVSVGFDGQPGSGECSAPVLTPDGRFVCFASRATNLTSAIPVGFRNIFVRDLLTDRTVLASPNQPTNPLYSYDLTDYTIGDDGGWVVYVTSETTLTRAITNGVPTTAFLCKVVTGSSHRLVVPGLSTLQPQTGIASVLNVALAPRRNRLAVQFQARHEGRSLSASNHIALLDLDTEALVFRTMAPWRDGVPTPLAFSGDGRSFAFAADISSSPNGAHPPVLHLWNEERGAQIFTNLATGEPIPVVELALNSEGTRVAFTTPISGLHAPPTVTNTFQLYLADITSRELRLMSATPTGEAAGGADDSAPSFGPDGLALMFQSASSSLITNDWNHAADVFLRPVPEGPLTLVSAALGRSIGVRSGWSSLAKRGLSADGRHVLFVTIATDLVPGSHDGALDVTVLDRRSGHADVVNLLPGTTGPMRATLGETVLSGNGRHVAFITSGATSSAGRPEVYVRDLASGTTRLVSVSVNGTPSRGKWYSHLRISSDGRFVAFYSDANDLAQGTLSMANAYLRDVFLERTYLVDYSEYNASGSRPDSLALAGLGGRVVAARSGSLSAFRAFLFDPITGEREELAGDVGTVALLSHDGRRLVLATPTAPFDLRWRDLPSTEWHSANLSLEPGHTYAWDRLSSDGRLALLRDVSATVPRGTAYVVELATGALVPLGVIADGNLSPALPSNSPALDGLGRLAAFESWTGDGVTAHPDPRPDIFLRDREARTTLLVSAGQGGALADDASFSPLLSADGQTLVFSSFASNLVEGDENGACDVFAAALPPRAFTDADSDALDDLWEWTWFGSLDRDGTGDYDSDGSSELSEYLAGTCPINDLSTFRVAIRRSTTGTTTLEWPTEPGRHYQLFARDEITSALIPLGETVAGDGYPISTPLPAASNARRFLQVAILPRD